MNTFQEILDKGYPLDWPVQCTKCYSFDCHEYYDIKFCFNCKKKTKVRHEQN